MSATFGTVDFGFRPIRPEEDYSGMECGEEDPPHGSSLAHPHASGATFRVAEDEADDLFISDTETLPDSTGFGARVGCLKQCHAGHVSSNGGVAIPFTLFVRSGFFRHPIRR